MKVQDLRNSTWIIVKHPLKNAYLNTFSNTPATIENNGMLGHLHKNTTSRVLRLEGMHEAT